MVETPITPEPSSVFYTNDQKDRFRQQFAVRKRHMPLLMVLSFPLLGLYLYADYTGQSLMSLLGISLTTVIVLLLSWLAAGLLLHIYCWRCPACRTYLGKEAKTVRCPGCSIELS